MCLTPPPPTPVTDPVLESMLEPLIHLLLSSDVDVQKSSSLALSNLALHGASEWKICIVDCASTVCVGTD